MRTETAWPPEITCEGFRLIGMRPDDAPELFAYLSDPAVTELTSYPEITRALVDSIIERVTKRWSAGELSKWGISDVADGRIVGTCGFNAWSVDHRWAELAYDLARVHWGKGIMSEALNGVIAWAFRETIVERIHAYVRVDNTRSGKLLERLGFEREGRLRNYRICRGQPHDFHVYGLLRSEFLDRLEESSATSDRKVK